MTYNELMKLYSTRRKGSSEKILKTWGGGFRLVMDGEDFLVERRDRTWTHNGVVVNGHISWMRINKDGTATLASEAKFDTASLRQLISDIFGGWCFSDATRLRRHKHKVRFCFHGRSDVPVTHSLVINVNAREIVHHDPDLVVTANRAKCKPVWDHVNHVLKVMDVLYRMGDFGDLMEATSIYTHRNNSKYCWGIHALTKVGLDDESIAEQAEAAFFAGLRVAGYDNYAAVVWDFSHGPGRRATQIPNPLSKAQHYAKQYAGVRKAAAAKLREQLKLNNEGCLELKAA
jgi:hypothetical protein